MKKWLGLLLPAALVGCGHPATSTTTNRLAGNDFENVDGWTGDAPPPSLTRDQAHSGAYSVVVRPGVDFSLGYNNPLRRLAPEWPAKLTISAWVLLPNEQATAKLVTELKPASGNGPNLLWDGLDLASTLNVYGKWQHVEKTIVLPEAATADSRLLVYLWRSESKEPAYLDDLEISLAK